MASHEDDNKSFCVLNYFTVPLSILDSYLPRAGLKQSQTSNFTFLLATK